MPILIKVPCIENSAIKEWAIVELQGELEVRGSSQKIYGQFIGDLSYNKYGQPILIIGHHILTGRETTFEKPLAVLEKRVYEEESPKPSADDDEAAHNDASIDESILLDDTQNRTVLDTTVAIENKTKVRTEYIVKAIVKRKLIFKARPKPIIANMPTE